MQPVGIVPPVGTDGLQKFDRIVEISQICIVFRDDARDRKPAIPDGIRRVAITLQWNTPVAAEKPLEAPECFDFRLRTFLLTYAIQALCCK